MKLKTLLFSALLSACTTAQINSTLGTVNDALNESATPTTSEVTGGLKQALEVGIKNSAQLASALDGYYKNPKIKIPFPPEVKEVETKLRQIGLGKEVDKFVVTLNRGAENAANKSVPIFVNAITSMSINDAWGILKGEDLAATNYLKKATYAQLQAEFKPVMKQSLDQVNATKYYGDLVSNYNKIPFVKKVNPNLDDYATEKAIDGLFYLVGEEEKKIRKDPMKRTTELLKKVFAQQD